ncbi:hypothetical protein IBE34_09910 [Francisella philomiragia]|nr:hypothetical protein [Francisella philomiragia]MBK2279861.1 hypothetical protein [Francisella philomiragia]MBK2286927.1 hypothetical protein [Francisella philomiragia]MBK2289737.1 hypothetical protein [Francisella philomiragia]MBK2291701.1 hypothetical protein [Francisella philomiragia]
MCKFLIQQYLQVIQNDLMKHLTHEDFCIMVQIMIMTQHEQTDNQLSLY